MINKKRRTKKGMTLIEVIISVTLLSILIVPISGFMLSSLKNNTSSQKKQEASYIGQKILEELKSYDYINLKRDSEGYYFELLDGDKVYKNSSVENLFYSEFNRNIYGKPIENDERKLRDYNVQLTVKENTSFKYNDINNLEINNDADYKIDFINENNINFIKVINSNIQIKKSFSGDIKVNVTKEDNEFNLSLYDKNNSDIKIEDLRKEKKNNKILLYVSSNYNIDTNIEVNNDTEEVLYLYIVKQDDTLANINVITSKGRIVLLEEEEITTNNIGSMYEYNVKVTDNENNILFEGQSSNNINIR